MNVYATTPIREGPRSGSPGNGRVAQYRQNGLLFLVLENQEIRTIVLPAVGGKMVELTKKSSGTQFLLQPSRGYSKAHLPYYGIDYFQYDPGGFIDCFPTIAASTMTKKEENGQPRTIHFPDHGELWGIPWKYNVSKDTPALYLHVEGVRRKYEFSKTIWLENATVHIEYRVINLSAVPFAYLWSAQPLLEAHPGAEIILAQGVDKVLLDWTTDPTLGQHGKYLPWPVGKPGRESNSAAIPDRPEKHTMKVYTDELVEGFCGYKRSDTGEKIRFEFDPKNIPYIGILWGSTGGASQTDQNHSTIALQPSRGRPDALQEAYAKNEYAELTALGMAEWSLRISLS